MSDLYDYFYNTLGSHGKAEEAMRRWKKSQLEKDEKEAEEYSKNEKKALGLEDEA